MLGGVFFMAGSAVLKPNLKQKQQTLCQGRDSSTEVWSSDHISLLLIREIVRGLHLGVKTCTEGGSMLMW